MTSSFCRAIASYLSSLNARSALYDEKMNLVWTNCRDFFENFDIGIIQKHLPIRKQTDLAVRDGDMKSVLSVVPILRSKRLVCAYALVLRDNYDVLNLVNNTFLADFAVKSVKDSQEKLSNIIGTNKAIKHILSTGGDITQVKPLMALQHKSSVKMYNEISSSLILSDCIMAPRENINCNVSALLDAVCNEVSALFKRSDRKVNKKIDTRSYYARVQSNFFSSAILCMLRSGIETSTLKSSIDISSVFSDGAYCISIKTETDPEAGSDVLMHSMYLRELSRKLIISDCSGGFAYKTDDKYNTVTIRIPVIKKNRGSALNMQNSPYLAGTFSPAYIFMLDLAEKEAEEVHGTDAFSDESIFDDEETVYEVNRPVGRPRKNPAEKKTAPKKAAAKRSSASKKRSADPAAKTVKKT